MYDDYRDSLGLYFKQTATHIIPGAILGYLTDEICRSLQLKLKLRPVTTVVIQVILIIVIMYWAEKFLAYRYNRSWRGKTPSLLFTSFFFILQATLFKNLLLVKASIPFVKDAKNAA